MNEWDEIQRKLDKPFDREIMEHTETEEWKAVPGFEENYEVSTFGRVRTIKRKRILKQHVDKNSFLSVSLHVKGTTASRSVSRLVARAFIQNSEGHSFVIHKDGNRLNNHVDNLEWAPRQLKRREYQQQNKNKELYMTVITRDDVDHENWFASKQEVRSYICNVLYNPYAGDYVLDNLGRAIVFGPDTNPEGKKVTVVASKIKV